MPPLEVYCSFLTLRALTLHVSLHIVIPEITQKRNSSASIHRGFRNLTKLNLHAKDENLYSNILEIRRYLATSLLRAHRCQEHRITNESLRKVQHIIKYSHNYPVFWVSEVYKYSIKTLKNSVVNVQTLSKPQKFRAVLEIWATGAR